MAHPTDLCPEQALAHLTELATSDTAQGLRRAESLLRDHPDDPRLLFLKGSLLAALRRYGEAEAPMREAVEIAPDYHIARFQLGLLHLSSGDPDRAAQVWAPLSALEAGDPLRLFAEGLQHMARDEFETARRLLNEGLGRNEAYPALDADMRLVLEAMPPQAEPPADMSSPAHWLLQMPSAKPTKH